MIADATLSGRHLGGFDLFAILGLGDLLLQPLGVANLAHAVNSSREIYAKYLQNLLHLKGVYATQITGGAHWLVYIPDHSRI